MGEFLTGAWAGYNTQFVSFGFTILAAIIFWLFQGRAKIRWGVQHGFTHRVTNEVGQGEQKQVHNTLVNNSAILFSNAGRIPAKKVEVTINFVPDSVAIWPQRQYSRHVNPDGRLIVSFDSFAPREHLTLNLLTIGGASPDVLSVRAENSVPIEIPIGPARIFSRPVQIVFAIWLLLGLAAAIYILITVLSWLVQIPR